MYHGDLAALNSAWKASYPSFEEVDVPPLLTTSNVVDPLAINSRRTFDLRKATDLMQRDVLTELHAYIQRKAPGSKWIGGCLLNSIGARGCPLLASA